MRKGIELRKQKLEDKPFKFDDYNQRLFDDFERQAPPGSYILEIKRMGKPKTNKQTATHFGLLINTIIVKANDDGTDTSAFLKLLVQEDLPTGIGLTKDFVHQLLYTLCPTYSEDGKRLTLSKMSTTEASDWLERCRNLLASRGFYVEEPDPNWKDKL